MELKVATEKLIETVRERTEVAFNCGECQQRMYLLQRKEKALKQKELFLQTFINRSGLPKKHKAVKLEVVVVGVKSQTKKIKIENEMGDEDDDVLVTAVEEASGNVEEIGGNGNRGNGEIFYQQEKKGVVKKEMVDNDNGVIIEAMKGASGISEEIGVEANSGKEEKSCQEGVVVKVEKEDVNFNMEYVEWNMLKGMLWKKVRRKFCR
ncbi:Hypothetical predicted protein [Mytilus galloprovincialis]|uniref:Uncharacterized protein n=1 Tax=Mytilus galloprovincialis TaxID=29158 RepID=A0A8B6E0V5_MYTGA|nr:Hypothetical predicted protein [Mytilus galloprovincialis]